MLHIYNSLTRQKEVFTPLEPGQVRMYVCGMTVYDYCHLGHARVMVVFDTVYRYLKTSGYVVEYVRNITDIDDKIIKRAAENGEPMDALTQRFIDAMHEDEDSLNVMRPDAEPRATGNVPEMLAMIQTLLDKGMAYQGKNGDVYYDVSKFNGYGKLSGRKLDELRAGERVAVDEIKDDPLDFVLWKAVKPGEPAWDAPWGQGRPGWHIECSAMSQKLLGDHFDIHGGGSDLQFPHHENEIAQSEGCIGHKHVNYWMHNGFIRVNDEKMSKSLNNFFTIREVLKDYKAAEVRFFILNSHYRSQLNYGTDQLDAARASLSRLYTAIRGLPESGPAAYTYYEKRFIAAMDDDFNTPEAIAVLFELAGDINRIRKTQSDASAAALGALLQRLGNVVGLLQEDPESWFKGAAGAGDLDDAAIESLIQQRLDARKAKQWAESDRIRDELKAQGVLLEDGAGGTTWKRA
ncbi:MAG: cysteine--tRNA ligase [Pseudomonadota bacterium]|jgi:cysteinyl-tRNA synthetase|uniref:Cysteine--tRNA ligase n=1 Tax=Thiothrix fructosivorans TaxID=111770 RepID=A0A8B0SL43_9GAMM|nr:cysteine--tRNA ligase [Thiothrix fructosivorans]MBO0611554.1 cysteine--tRNA ligase [Thiothrix fructosivorans]QTX10778.1 cysteine--tRNA ligase [Thiothrix fructosivorans]